MMCFAVDPQVRQVVVVRVAVDVMYLKLAAVGG
jgi:hypothetical protein